MPKKKRNPTIREIAAACNIGVMTVSRALRPGSPVAEETRALVLRTAKKMGYQPNVKMGRPRRTNKRKRPAVDLLMTSTLGSDSSFLAELLVAIQKELGRTQHDCIIHTCSQVYEEFLALTHALRERMTIGTMVVGHLPLEQLRTILEIIPDAMLVDHTGDPRLAAPYSSVGFDNVEAGRMAVRHMLARGRRRIALLRGPGEHYFARDTEQGFCEALRAAQIEPDPRLVWTGDFSAAGAYEAVNRALDNSPEFDAVITNDEMAFGVLKALAGRGIDVPAKVAVMGCDGLALAAFASPPLTTIVMDREELGRTAVQRLLQGSQSRAAAQRIRLVPKLLVRAST